MPELMCTPTVVVGRLDVVAHRSDLRVLAQHVVVVRRARVLHRAQRDTLDLGREDALTDQPVRVSGRLTRLALLDHAAEDVGHRLVERSRLSFVGERRRVLRHRVAELVAEHVEGPGEATEHLAVAVAEDQLVTVPEGVVVVAAVVDGRDDRGALVVVGTPRQHRCEEVQGRGQTGGGLVDGGVAGLAVSGRAHEGAGQRRAVFGVVDRPLRLIGLTRDAEEIGAARMVASLVPQLGVEDQGGGAATGTLRDPGAMRRSARGGRSG